MSKFKVQYKSGDTPFLDLKIHNAGHEACDPLHTWTGMREFYSIHTIVEGKGYYTIDEHTFSLEKGDTFLIFPNTLVKYWADESSPWEYLWLGISGLYVKHLLECTEFTPQNPCLTKASQVSLLAELEAISKVQGNDLASELQIVGYTYQCLAKLVGEHKKKKGESKENFAQKAKEFMELNYSHGITPQQVADKLNISRSHLHRLFTKEYDISVGRYINMLQMNRASLLLTTTTLSIGEISNSVGYENQLYFSNVFKKQFGCSPSLFRQKNDKTT